MTQQLCLLVCICEGELVSVIASSKKKKPGTVRKTLPNRVVSSCMNQSNSCQHTAVQDSHCLTLFYRRHKEPTKSHAARFLFCFSSSRSLSVFSFLPTFPVISPIPPSTLLRLDKITKQCSDHKMATVSSLYISTVKPLSDRRGHATRWSLGSTLPTGA